MHLRLRIGSDACPYYGVTSLLGRADKLPLRPKLLFTPGRHRTDTFPTQKGLLKSLPDIPFCVDTEVT